MLMIGSDTVPGTLAHVLVSGASRRAIVHPDIKHVHAARVFAVVPPDVRQWSIGLDYNGNPMQLRVARVKYVPGHQATAAPKNRSNAAVRSAAIAWGDRPSI